MSWITQFLIMKRDELEVNPDFESEEYNDLLIIEKKISELKEKGILSPIELRIIDLMSEGKTFKDLEEIVGMSRVTISKIFIKACYKISYSIGDIFTDSGYLEYMKKKYKLTNKEIERLEEYIVSKFKHKIMKGAKSEPASKKS